MTLPDSLQVICRGWLNANHVLFLDPEDNVLIDTAYCTHAQETLRLLRQPAALGPAALHRVINTHCHADHMGGNATLQAEYGCTIHIPEGEQAHIRDWDGRALWLDVAGQQAEPFRVDGLIGAGQTLVLGGLEWQTIAAPGHRMEALIFHCPEFKILISGDALWENGLGVVEPTEGFFMDAAFDTLDVIAELDVDLVIPGHGWPFGEVASALDRARSRLRSVKDDPVKMAMSMMKALLMFNLLEKGSFAAEALPAYLESLWFFREMNRRYLGLAPDELAQQLITSLIRSRVVALQADRLIPLIPA